ncbi:MAG: hypothetical protein JXR25_09305 [Pontiellaceae bacterium]|nr:hypothetical protein [Pontiellaceae bacterium]MBN2785012.1 hypothetical protein [Pontiellaceae bacterium]
MDAVRQRNVKAVDEMTMDISTTDWWAFGSLVSARSKVDNGLFIPPPNGSEAGRETGKTNTTEGIKL